MKKNPERKLTELCIENNIPLLQQLNEMGINKVMIGSNRQDVDKDLQKGTYGSCYPALAAISKYLDAIFDSFSLGDLYSNLRHGHTVQEANSYQENSQYPKGFRVENAEAISKWAFDRNKISIVYAQIQKLALENPEKEIEYTFIDDDKEILSAVEEFFEKNPGMIPGNVTIKTYSYSDINNDVKNPSMQLEERKTIPSYSKAIKPNEHYELTLRSWAIKNIDSEGNIKTVPESYSSLSEEHKAMVNSPKAKMITDTQLAYEQDHLNNPINNQRLRDTLHFILQENKSTKKLEGKLDSFDEIKKALVKIYLDAWDKEYHKGKLNIGYSAVLKGITKELESYPELHRMVKNEVSNHFQNEAAQEKTQHERYRMNSNFRKQVFEEDWAKFTGSKTNIAQEALKGFLRKIKHSENKDEEQECDGETVRP